MVGFVWILLPHCGGLYEYYFAMVGIFLNKIVIYTGAEILIDESLRKCTLGVNVEKNHILLEGGHGNWRFSQFFLI